MSTCSRRACAALATLADQAAVEMARYRRLHTDVEHAAGVLGAQHPAARLVEQMATNLTDPLARVLFDAFTAAPDPAGPGASSE